MVGRNIRSPSRFLAPDIHSSLIYSIKQESSCSVKGFCRCNQHPKSVNFQIGRLSSMRLIKCILLRLFLDPMLVQLLCNVTRTHCSASPSLIYWLDLVGLKQKTQQSKLSFPHLFCLLALFPLFLSLFIHVFSQLVSQFLTSLS